MMLLERPSKIMLRLWRIRERQLESKDLLRLMKRLERRSKTRKMRMIDLQRN